MLSSGLLGERHGQETFDLVDGRTGVGLGDHPVTTGGADPPSVIL